MATVPAWAGHVPSASDSALAGLEELSVVDLPSPEVEASPSWAGEALGDRGEGTDLHFGDAFADIPLEAQAVEGELYAAWSGLTGNAILRTEDALREAWPAVAALAELWWELRPSGLDSLSAFLGVEPGLVFCIATLCLLIIARRRRRKAPQPEACLRDDQRRAVSAGAAGPGGSPPVRFAAAPAVEVARPCPSPSPVKVTMTASPLRAAVAAAASPMKAPLAASASRAPARRARRLEAPPAPIVWGSRFRYASKLRELREMGFDQDDAELQAVLTRHKGVLELVAADLIDDRGY